LIGELLDKLTHFRNVTVL